MPKTFDPRSFPHGLMLGVGDPSSPKGRAFSMQHRAAVPEETPEAAEARRAAEIVTACGFGDVPDRAPAFIAKGMSVGDVLHILNAEREAAELWMKVIGRHNEEFARRH